MKLPSKPIDDITAAARAESLRRALEEIRAELDWLNRIGLAEFLDNEAWASLDAALATADAALLDDDLARCRPSRAAVLRGLEAPIAFDATGGTLP